jgi:AIR synthase related protein, N-terminal domain
MSTTADREDRVLERIDKFRQRRPRLLDDVVTLAHGAGGKASAALVDAVFLEAFRNDELEQLGDAAALLTPSGERLAFSTDSYVVSPRRFPGGSIGHVAVHGTINDLAVSGAHPQWLSAAFVIEEGFPIAELREIVADMSEAAAKAGVQIVTGDTKVVGKGAADGVYISTAGVGVIPEGRRLSRDLVQPGDKVVLSGTWPSTPTSHPTPRPCTNWSRHYLPRRRRRDGCATRRAAASAPWPTNWSRILRSRSSWTRTNCRCSRRCSAPATCSVSTRCTWRTRANSSP